MFPIRQNAALTEKSLIYVFSGSVTFVPLFNTYLPFCLSFTVLSDPFPVNFPLTLSLS